jgi:phosphohistidine phosphatase
VTTRSLVLVRHAKSESDGGVDARRPLAERGVADARAVGGWLAGHGLIPDRVVVSPARRARQTWDLARAELKEAPEPVVDERIYANTVGDLLAVVGETPPDVRTLVVVGHNPSMAELALALDDGRGDAGARTELGRKYPTSGVAVFAVDGEWAAVDGPAGTLTDFSVPRG